MFTSDANVLLLDEPDNYLDIPAKQWMEDQVRNSGKTILMISHKQRPVRSPRTENVSSSPIQRAEHSVGGRYGRLLISAGGSRAVVAVALGGARMDVMPDDRALEPVPPIPTVSRRCEGAA